MEGEPPKGLTVQRDGTDSYTVTTRPTGMGCMRLFFLVWLSGWTAGCVAMTLGYVSVEGVSERPPPWGIAALFWLCDVGVGLVAAHLFFTVRTLRLTRYDLTLETNLFGWRRARTVDRAAIRAVRQVRDGGDGEDSFPSWGLKVETGEKPLSVLFREAREKSDWLGRFLANWAKVEFHGTSER